MAWKDKYNIFGDINSESSMYIFGGNAIQDAAAFTKFFLYKNFVNQISGIKEIENLNEIIEGEVGKNPPAHKLYLDAVSYMETYGRYVANAPQSPILEKFFSFNPLGDGIDESQNELLLEALQRKYGADRTSLKVKAVTILLTEAKMKMKIT
jgi:hypothetical protein